MKRFVLFCLVFVIAGAQFLLSENTPEIKFGAYVDTYISTDNAKLPDELSDFRGFSFINPKKNEFGVNIAQISASMKYGNLLRGNVTIHAGDLKTSAWSGTDTYIQQANGGVQLFENFWLDAGYFTTHVGGEAILPKDNWLTSHSLVTFFEPFYQLGMRLSYETEKFTGQFHLLNGNGIYKDNNYNKTFGWFFSYILSDKLTLSYSGVAGNEEPGSPNNCKLLHLHNIVAYLNLVENLDMKAQLDFAQKADSKFDNDATSASAGSYLGASFQARYHFIEKLSGTFRFSYINNDHVFSAYNMDELTGMDITLGAEYKPTTTSYLRLEGRMLNFDDKYKIFLVDDEFTNSKYEILLNIGMWLD